MTLSPRLHLVAAGALVAVLLVESFSASRQKSPVFDEPAHIASGLSYVDTRVFVANLQHPPLLKELSALSLWTAGIHWPDTPPAVALIRGDFENSRLEWPIGNDIIAANPDRVMFRARLPFPLLAGLLAFLIYWWGRELVGPGAALLAELLYVLDPTIVAHSYLVTTDIGLATFTFLFLFALWRYIRRPSWPRILLCGVAMGAVLSTKFSALILWPTTAVLLLAVAVTAVPRRVMASLIAFAVMTAVAILVIEAVYLFSGDPLLYLTGAGRVNADHASTYLAIFNGEMAKRFYSYFIAALLLKEPLGIVIAASVGLAIVLLRRPLSRPVMLFLLLPPAVFVLANTLMAEDIGVRYIIPALPFAHLLGGLALFTLFTRREVWSRAAAGLLCVWLVVEAVGIYPDHLSYFNESACLLKSSDQIGMDGGSRCGPLWFDDSNVDWGQGVKQLRTWMDQNGRGRTLRLTYFGTFPPENYDLAYTTVNFDALACRPPAGLYAVSAHFVARIEAALKANAPLAVPWTQQLSPVAIVGHAFYIYDVQ